MANDTLRSHLRRLLDRANEVRANSVGKTQDVASGFADGLQAAIEAVDALAEPEPNGERWLVLIGSPLLGYSFHGPFTKWADAAAWGERHAPNAEFHVAPLIIHPAPSGPVLAVNNDNEPNGPH